MTSLPFNKKRTAMTNKAFSTSGLKLVFEEAAEEAVVRCTGQITAASCEMFQREIKLNLIPASRGKGVYVNSRIVLDLSKVTCIDDAGQAAITELRKAGQKRGCAVETLNFTSPWQKLMNMAGLDNMFAKIDARAARFSRSHKREALL